MVTGAQGAGPEGQGQLDRQPGLFGALQVRLPAFPALFGPRVQPWDSCPPGLMPCPRAGGNGSIPGYWGGGRRGVTVLIGTTPHPCPAPQLLCPVSPRNKAESAHKCPEANVKGKRAPNHVPREAGPPGRRGGRWNRPAQGGHSLWLSDPTRWDASPRAVPSAHSLPLCLKCHPLRNHTTQKLGSSEPVRS